MFEKTFINVLEMWEPYCFFFLLKVADIQELFVGIL